jgi:transposase
VVEPIDMRAGIDGLSQRIQDSLGRTPCDGNAYAFRNRRQNRLKLLIWDGTGRLALPAPAASRPLHLAPRRHPGLHVDGRTMAMADHRR